LTAVIFIENRFLPTLTNDRIAARISDSDGWGRQLPRMLIRRLRSPFTALTLFWRRETAMGSKLWSRRLMIGGVLGGLGVLHILCPLQIGVVSGASMEPSFHSRQVILIDRHYYRAHPVKRGDVVIAREGDTVLIKRVYALGGDTFWTLLNADDGQLYREIVEPGMLARMRRLMPMLPSYRLTRFRVPEGSVYVVGDNSSASIDSRHFGPISVSAIMGRVRNAPPEADSRRGAIVRREEGTGPGTYPVSRASIR
jgi:signal peptidase I